MANASSLSAPTTNRRIIGSPALLPVFLLLTLALLLGVMALSVAFGAADIDLTTVFNALFHYDAANGDHVIIHVVRLPRMLAGVVIGAGLAVAGAIMQGLTANPLADPGILGIQAGAAFAVVLGVFILGSPSLLVYAGLALIGAAIAAVLVYGIAALGRGGASPLKLTLAGTIFTAFTTSLTTALLITDRDTLDQIRFWTVGSLNGRDMTLFYSTAPIIAIGLIGAMLISRQITTISMGEDVAMGLGLDTIRLKVIAAILVVLLAGGAVALAGPVGFIGLMIPHVVRALVGVDYRWILPYAAVFGALLVTLADTVGRVIARPQELPIGIVLAFVGAPFFIYIARWKVRR
jgi:iron complex transport system permease protein